MSMPLHIHSAFSCAYVHCYRLLLLVTYLIMVNSVVLFLYVDMSLQMEKKQVLCTFLTMALLCVHRRLPLIY